MPARRTYLASLASLSTPTIAGCSGFPGIGTEDTTNTTDTTTMTDGNGERADVSSLTIDDGETIPAKHTCDGQDVSPPLSPEIRDAAETWALVMTDPDAPSGTFTHWLIWNLPEDRSLPEDVPREDTVDSPDGAPQGTNDFGDIGYGGPCPPEGDDPHTYVFDVYALDDALDVDAGAERDELESAIAETKAVVGTGTLEAEYER